MNEFVSRFDDLFFVAHFVAQKKNGSLKNWDGALEPSKRFPAYSAIPWEMITWGLDAFVTKSTQTFFDQLKIETEFLDQDSATWE